MSTFLNSRLAAAAAALLLAGSLAGCSDDTPTSGDSTPTAASSTPTMAASTPATIPSGGAASTRPQVCLDIVQARASLVKVTSVAVLAQGRDAIRAQWETAKADVNTAIESARTEFPTEAQALRDAVDRVQAAVDALEASPSPTGLGELGRAVVAATAALTDLNAALGETC